MKVEQAHGSHYPRRGFAVGVCGGSAEAIEKKLAPRGVFIPRVMCFSKKTNEATSVSHSPHCDTFLVDIPNYGIDRRQEVTRVGVQVRRLALQWGFHLVQMRKLRRDTIEKQTCIAV
jgi:hypothetical protein